MLPDSQCDDIPDDSEDSQSEATSVSPKPPQPSLEEHTEKYGDESSLRTQDDLDRKADGQDADITGWPTEARAARQRQSTELPPDHFINYDGKVMDVEKYLETKMWKVKTILKKRIRSKKPEYLCEWEDTFETRRMYKALKKYKGTGYPCENLGCINRDDLFPGQTVKMIKCQWKPKWEKEKYVTKDLIKAYKKEQAEIQKRKRAEKKAAERRAARAH